MTPFYGWSSTASLGGGANLIFGGERRHRAKYTKVNCFSLKYHIYIYVYIYIPHIYIHIYIYIIPKYSN